VQPYNSRYTEKGIAQVIERLSQPMVVSYLERERKRDGERDVF